MPRQINRLTNLKIRAIDTPGRHADGGGLYLVVDKSGAKRWAFMSWRGGRQIELGMGGLSSVSLKQAREVATNCRILIQQGADPRKAIKSSRTTPQFGEFALEVIEAIETGFRNEKHRQQWRNTLTTYAKPLWHKPVDIVDTEDLLAVLKPIWNTKHETASRVRGRIERVLDAAAARGLRTTMNPARWKGHLQMLLPERQKLTRGHHPAMSYKDVPAFVAELRELNTVAAQCLEFVILTACRTGEVLLKKRDRQKLGATWSEFDLEKGVWCIPPERMKAGRAHRIPLAPRASEIIRQLSETQQSEFVFPGHRSDAPLSNMALEMVMRRLDAKPYTVHGFRSSFRDWVGDETEFAPEVAEAALAHTLGTSVERAYRRRDALERRRELMNAWADYCGEISEQGPNR